MVCSKSYRGRYASPALAAASYPFVDLPSGDTLRCKLFPADKFYKISLYFDGRIKYNEDDNKSVFNEEVMIMSRNIKGGFLTLGGIVGIVGTIIAAMQNPATAWVTPPGRMIVSILENGLLIPTVLFLVLFIYGLYILLTEKSD